MFIGFPDKFAKPAFYAGLVSLDFTGDNRRGAPQRSNRCVDCYSTQKSVHNSGNNVSFRFRLVHSPVQATPMTQSAARAAMHGAKREYPEYAWGMEGGFNSGEFLVHGQKQK